MTDISKKLRILPGARVLTLGAPDSFPSLLDPLPDKAILSTRATGTFDVVMLFVADSKALEKGLPRATAALGDESVLWICYPKKTSGIKTDMTRDVGWNVVQDAGFGPVSQAAIDETWSALRFKQESTVERKQGSAIAPGAAKKAAPQKRVIPPADLVVALGTNDAATATWKTLASSHIKEYVLWIEDAKRPETRARRVEQTITMLAAGVRNRNEKYAGK
ncbi:MAG: YdeI/OmpD-associated family protein [Polyangiaceae bacterium]|nr:YdeI/OmpD-associated family protein [Polyangiaceae bacterium]